MNSRKLLVGLIIAALAAGGGYWFGSRDANSPMAMTDTSDEPKVLFYRSPMNPQVTSDVPAKDPMGMDYVAVYADDNEESGPAGTVRIDPVVVQSIGVRTAPAERRSLAHVIHTVGRVAYDEKRLFRLHPKMAGWIDELYVDVTGAPVTKGTNLLSLYAPKLVSTQQEYVLAARNLKSLQSSQFDDVRRGAEQLVAASLERLRMFDVPEHQLKALVATLEVQKNLHIQAPASGIVMSIGAREGQYVTPGTELYMLADLSRVWVLVDIYEDELPWVSVGDPATITVAAIPGRTFSGTISYIYPYAEGKTRTIKLRMEFANPDGMLRPDMYADVSVDASPLESVIAVPSSAIVRSGVREQVFVEREPGKFEPRPVVLGVNSDGWTQILEGVEPGEEVVVSAQFLIDSESSLREAAVKMQEVVP